MSELMTWVLLTLFGYVGLPTLLMRFGFARALRKENARRPLVALTFDDGPDPFWTPVILEILDRFNVNACFFMLGAKAAAYPDLVRRVAEAGHEIGVHGFKHAVPAFLGFRKTMQDVSQTTEVLTAITGKHPRFMRPPWGVFNLWTALAARRNGLIPVVWSLHVYEWDRSTTPRSILTTAMRRSHPGMVLLLHDSAGPGSREDAPEVVATALPRLITGLREEGYHLVSLSQLLDSPQGGTATAAPDRTGAVDSGGTGAVDSGRAQEGLHMPQLIALWDRAVRRLMAIRPVAEGSVIGYALRRYPGRSLTGTDGVTLGRGERVIELHLDSRAIESRTAGASTHQRILFLRREMLAALRELALLVRNDPRFAGIQGVWALTVLHRGVDRLGFTVVPVPPSLTRWLAGRYMKALLSAYHPDGVERLHQREQVLEPAEIFLSREMLLQRYGVGG